MNAPRDSLVLRVRPLHFEFEALDAVRFPAGKAANIFRGAFGEIFRRIACAPDCQDARSCPRAPECAYARIFEPRGMSGGEGEHGSPSGFQDRPRPFVLRAAPLDGQSFEFGERFALDVNVFDPDVPALDYFREAFARLFGEGIGPGRPRVALIASTELPVIRIDLMAQPESVERIRLAFLTPTELKCGGEILREPRFDALIKRTRDRVTGLIGFYQTEPAMRDEIAKKVDFRGMAERANAIRMTAGRIERRDYDRRSARTGQRHSLGGFTGEAEYEGDLTEFVPFLDALWWTGVGRLTTWGNGMVRVAAR